jgi:hypothetical protein
MMIGPATEALDPAKRISCSEWLETVAHDDRRAIQLADDGLVVLNDLGQSEYCDWGRVPAQLLDVAHAVPIFCDYSIAILLAD